MNMASIGILVFGFFIFTYINAGNAKQKFINVQCQTKNVGQYGQQSVLKCVIHTEEVVTDAEIRVVTWKKRGDNKALLLFNRGETVLQPGYLFAEPSWNERNMNVSLLITNTSVAHEGEYECMVMTNSGDDTIHASLKVTAKYNVPTIQSMPEKMTLTTDGTLMCESDGGYPKGELRWFDGHNTDWTTSSEMEVKQTESGLFHLSSRLTLTKNSIFPPYTCVVFNATGGKEEAATFEIPNVPQTREGTNNSKELNPTSRIVAPVVVIGSLIAGLLMALLFYRRRSQQARRQSTTPLMGDHQDNGERWSSDKKRQDAVV